MAVCTTEHRYNLSALYVGTFCSIGTSKFKWFCTFFNIPTCKNICQIISGIHRNWENFNAQTNLHHFSLMNVELCRLIIHFGLECCQDANDDVDDADCSIFELKAVPGLDKLLWRNECFSIV